MAQKDKLGDSDILGLIRPEIKKLAQAVDSLLPSAARTGSTSEVLTRGLGVIARRLKSKGGIWPDFVGELSDALKEEEGAISKNSDNWQKFLDDARKRLQDPNTDPTAVAVRIQAEFTALTQVMQAIQQWEQSQGSPKSESIDWNEIWSKIQAGWQQLIGQCNIFAQTSRVLRKADEELAQSIDQSAQRIREAWTPLRWLRRRNSHGRQ